MNIQKTVVLALASVAFIACNSTKESAPVAKETEKEEVVTYSNTIKSLVNRKCVGCHKIYGSGGLSLVTYENVKDATEKGKLLKRINDEAKPMPKAGLMSEKNRQLFQKWAVSGYKK